MYAGEGKGGYYSKLSKPIPPPKISDKDKVNFDQAWTGVSGIRISRCFPASLILLLFFWSCSQAAGYRQQLASSRGELVHSNTQLATQVNLLQQLQEQVRREKEGEVCHRE